MPRSTHARRELRAHVAGELRALGDTKDDVARRLDAAGVRGAANNVSDCAVAVYLSAVVAADARVAAVLVGNDRVFVKVEGSRWYVGVPLTKPLRAFVTDFDRHRYPTLERPATGRAYGAPGHTTPAGRLA